MKKSLTVTIDEDIYKRFCEVVAKREEKMTKSRMIEGYMRKIIKNAEKEQNKIV